MRRQIIFLPICVPKTTIITIKNKISSFISILFDNYKTKKKKKSSNYKEKITRNNQKNKEVTNEKIDMLSTS